jgi:hypothetical protein
MTQIKQGSIFKRFWFFGAMGGAGLIFLILAAIFTKKEKTGDLFLHDSGNYARHGTPIFTHEVVDIAEIRLIVPMGQADSGPKVNAVTGAGAHNIPSDHSSPAFADCLKPHKTYAVADGTLVAISYDTGRWIPPAGQTQKLDDYSLSFQFTKNFFLFITHFTRLDPEMVNRLGELQDGDLKTYNIPVKAGTLLGYTGGSEYLCTFDFWAVDLDSKPAFLGSPRYSGRGAHSVDPYQFFIEPIKGQMYAKLPDRPEPRVGRYDFDIDGKLIGNWFPVHPAGGGAAYTPTLSFFYDNFDPSKILIGNTETNTVDAVVGNAPDPATIDQHSGMVKYELFDKDEKTDVAFTKAVVLVQMVEKRKIKFEVFPNKSASEVTGFDDQAEYYVR